MNVRAEVGGLPGHWRIKRARPVLALMWLADSLMSLFSLGCSSGVFKDVATSGGQRYSVGSACCSLEGSRLQCRAISDIYTAQIH